MDQCHYHLWIKHKLQFFVRPQTFWNCCVPICNPSPRCLSLLFRKDKSKMTLWEGGEIIDSKERSKLLILTKSTISTLLIFVHELCFNSTVIRSIAYIIAIIAAAEIIRESRDWKQNPEQFSRLISLASVPSQIQPQRYFSTGIPTHTSGHRFTRWIM